MINICQLTNFDLDNADIVTHENIHKGGEILPTWDYKVITSEMLGSDSIFKLGYCVNDNEGMDYPIYLVFKAFPEEAVCFYLGKTGMFEFQSEEWRDVNDDDTERTAEVEISAIHVPAGVPFCLDYCYTTNAQKLTRRELEKLAYTQAVKNGFKGTMAEYLQTLKGDNGKSAYELAVDGGYKGTLSDWLSSLQGKNGSNGKSAYELAVENGYNGTLAEWLESLEHTGKDGKSAYDLAVENGYAGTLSEWLNSLKGANGDGVTEEEISRSVSSYIENHKGEFNTTSMVEFTDNDLESMW